jgi:deoxyinosine 3'endonuclease (endonuclease V)
MDVEAWKARLCDMQNEIRGRVNTSVPVPNPRFVGGCDLTVDGDLMVGCFVVVDTSKNSESIYDKCTIVNVDVPYIPGLLCFREGPVVLACLKEFQEAMPEIKLDLVLVDGSGEWHPRRFGLGCYVGVECGLPTIGVHKNFLFVGSPDSAKSVQADAQTKCPNKGDVFLIQHQLPEGETISLGVMRTTESVPHRPIFISAGHLIDIQSSIDIVRQLCHFREPEPLRLADRISREFVRKRKQGK